MKKILLRGLLLLLVAVMCVQLVACGGGNKEPSGNDTSANTTGGDNGGTTAPDNGGNNGGTTAPDNGGNNGGTTTPSVTTPTDVIYSADIVKNGVSDYVVVYPADADDLVMDCVLAITNAFSEKFGITLTSVPDSTPEVANEILVGQTNRAQSSEVKAPLLFGDSVCTVVDTKVVLISPDDNKLSGVVASFVTKVNETAGNNLSFSSRNAILNTAKYDVYDIKIDGVEVNEFVIVVPEFDGIEHYMARVLSRYIAGWSGIRLNIVTDDAEKAAHEIRIGVTNRTVTTVTAGEYAVMPKDGNMEIVFDDIESMSALGFTLTNNYFNRNAIWLDIKLVENGEKVFVGNDWDVADDGVTPVDIGDFVYPSRVQSELSATKDKADANDLRIMYQDVYGHLSTDPDSVTPDSRAARAALLIEVYEAYKPDILCLEEAGEEFPVKAKVLFDWLLANGYKMIRDDAKGLALPIFYNSDRVTLLNTKNSSGFLQRENGEVKGIAYATFKDKTNGEIFGVVNVHFSGDGDVYQVESESAAEEAKAFLAGSVARTTESELVLKAVENIRKAEKNCSSVIVGGNFNHHRGQFAEEVDEDGMPTGNLIDPLQTLLDGGLLEIRDKSELDPAKNSQYAPYDSASKINSNYVKDYDFINFVTAKKNSADRVEENEKVKYSGSADFIYYDGKAGDFDAKMYEVVTDVVAATSSDHLPHFVDIAWK